MNVGPRNEQPPCPWHRTRTNNPDAIPAPSVVDAFLESSMTEEWRAATVSSDYAVSSLGRVRRTTAGKGARKDAILKGGRAKSGYRTVNLACGGAGKTYNVHQLVCLAFHGPKPEGHEVAHGNGDRADNRAGNLRWATRKENADDRMAHGTVVRGASHPASKTTQRQVDAIRVDARPLPQIAADYGLCAATVHNIKKGKTWNHVGTEA